MSANETLIEIRCAVRSCRRVLAAIPVTDLSEEGVWKRHGVLVEPCPEHNAAELEMMGQVFSGFGSPEGPPEIECRTPWQFDPRNYARGFGGRTMLVFGQIQADIERATVKYMKITSRGNRWRPVVILSDGTGLVPTGMSSSSPVDPA